MRHILVVLLLVPGVAMAQPEPTDPKPAEAPAPPDPVATPAVATVPVSTTVSTTVDGAVAAAPDLTSKWSGAGKPPPGGWRVMLSDLSVLRLNPLGIETRGRFGMQKRLYASETKLGMNNFMFLGVYPKLNPASAHLAAGGEIQPVAMFNLRATAEVQKYFGTFGFLQSFTSPDANYSDNRLADLETVPGFEPQAATAFHVSVQPLLQAKVGPVAIRSLFQLDYWDFKLRAGDTAAYEATFDTLLPDQGFTISADTDVLYTGRPGLAIGLRHTWVQPIYKQRHFDDPDLSAAENTAELEAYDNANAHQRVGLFAAYTLKDRGPSKFNKPTVILIASWYLTHRFRTGAPDVMRPGDTGDDFTSRAFPYLLVGFAFESDLMAVR